jgi:hypothetical protein
VLQASLGEYHRTESDDYLRVYGKRCHFHEERHGRGVTVGALRALDYLLLYRPCTQRGVLPEMEFVRRKNCLKEH